MTATVSAPAGARLKVFAESRAGRRLGIAVSFSLLCVAFAFLYGLVPGHSLPFAGVASTEGWVLCLQEGGSRCDLVGYPIGVNLSLSTMTIGSALLLSKIGLSPEAALNVLGMICIAAGVGGLWVLTFSFTRSHVAGALAAFLYFASPIVAAHAGLPSLFFGFALLPVPVAFGTLALRVSRPRPGAAVGLAAGVLLAGTALIYFDPYPWAVGAALIVAATLVVAVVAVAHRQVRGAVAALTVLLAAGLPGIIFSTLESSSDLTTRMPPSFYRAMGVDLAVMVAPTRDQLIGQVVRSPIRSWDRTEFYGDGSQLSSSYIGLPTLAAFAGGAVLLARRRPKRAVALGLLIGALACLVLSLGPSLKLLDRASRPIAQDGRFEFSDYLMPAEEATLSFSWGTLFDHQPFASMRATYRWQSGFRLIVVVMAATLVATLASGRRVAALGLAAVLVLDAVPTLLWDLDQRAQSEHSQLEVFREDMERAFGGRLHPGERVLFLPAGNDYLVQYIAPTFEIATYNIAFDKEIERIRPLQPKPVRRAISQYEAGTLGTGALCRLFAEDLVDTVAFNDFDMRWDSYRWPSPPTMTASHRARNAALGIFDEPAFDIDAGYLSVIVRPGEEGRCDRTG